MKKIYYILMIAGLTLLSSCHEPQFVEPTVERQGITSLTAYFTQGKFVEKEMGKLDLSNVDASEMTRYEIPIAPSPNLPTQHSIYLYPSTCLFEGTVCSLGRGTDFPFEGYGHPDYTRRNPRPPFQCRAPDIRL